MILLTLLGIAGIFWFGANALLCAQLYDGARAVDKPSWQEGFNLHGSLCLASGIALLVSMAWSARRWLPRPEEST